MCTTLLYNHTITMQAVLHCLIFLNNFKTDCRIELNLNETILLYHIYIKLHIGANKKYQFQKKLKVSKY